MLLDISVEILDPWITQCVVSSLGFITLGPDDLTTSERRVTWKMNYK
jgi:hypothetical protein